MKLESSNEKLNGEMIKAIRQRYGLSQQEFGARLGVTHAHISKIESGKENPSETLLKLIKYEFKVDKFLGVPSSTVTKPKIKQYLNILEDLMLKHKKSDGCLYNTEFMLAALITIYRDTNKSEMYQELLLDSLSGIIDEIAQFIETTQKEPVGEDSILLQGSKLSRLKNEVGSCLDNLYSLLEERIR